VKATHLLGLDRSSSSFVCYGIHLPSTHRRKLPISLSGQPCSSLTHSRVRIIPSKNLRNGSKASRAMWGNDPWRGRFLHITYHPEDFYSFVSIFLQQTACSAWDNILFPSLFYCVVKAQRTLPLHHIQSHDQEVKRPLFSRTTEEVSIINITIFKQPFLRPQTPLGIIRAAYASDSFQNSQA
jgi:hypothetical protein